MRLKDDGKIDEILLNHMGVKNTQTKTGNIIVDKLEERYNRRRY